MAKLRNSSSDIGRFVQWMGRKCRNHNPLEELGINASKRPNTYKAKYTGSVYVDSSNEAVMFYRAGNRVFMITAEEITDADVQEKNLVAVGY